MSKGQLLVGAKVRYILALFLSIAREQRKRVPILAGSKESTRGGY